MACSAADYYVNSSGGDYANLTTCLQAVIDTADSCVLNEPNTNWTVEGFGLTGYTATCTASAQQDGNPCAHAIDGNEDTRWNSGNHAPQWLNITLDSAQTVDNVTISCEGGSGHYGNITLTDSSGSVLDSQEYANSTNPCIGDSPITVNFSSVANVKHVIDDAQGSGDWVADREVYLNGQSFNSTYYHASGVIKIETHDLKLDCLGNDLLGTDLLLYYNRQGGNIIVKNCIFNSTGSNYAMNLDGYLYDPIIVDNVTAVGGASFTSGYQNISNFVSDGYLLSFTGYGQGAYVIRNVSVIGSSLRFDQVVNSIADNVSISGGTLDLVGSDYYDNFSNFNISPYADGVDVAGTYNRFENFTVESPVRGVYAGSSAGSNDFVNFTITNCSEEAILNEWVNNQFFNFTISDCGNASSSGSFKASYSPRAYNGTDYDGCEKFVNSAGSAMQLVSSDGTAISFADGTNNFGMWLYRDDNNILDCYAGANATVFIDSAFPYACADIVGLYGGYCEMDYADALVANGATANYSWDGSAGTTPVTGSTDPPYLNYNETLTQTKYPIQGSANGGSNYSGILVHNPNRTTAYAADWSGNTNAYDYVWNSIFLYDARYNASDLISFCVNGQGNFFANGTSPPSGDCGVGFTSPANNSLVFNEFSLDWKDNLASGFDGNASLFRDGIFLANSSNYSFLENISGYTPANPPNITYTAANYLSLEGSVYAESRNASITLKVDSAPTQSTPILNSSSGLNRSNENLTVWNQSTSDVDGNEVVNVYDWRLNSKSLAVLNMPFETNSTRTVEDYSSFGNNGTMYGAVWTGSGKSGGAYVFNGMDSVITVNDSPSLKITGNITMAAWVTADTLQDWDVIMFKATDDSWADGYAVYYLSGQICAYVKEYSAYSVCSPFSADSGYNMVAATYNGSIMTLYLNGTSTDSSEFSTAITPNSANLTIGLTHYGSYAWDGMIDEVQIYNRSLSPQQINALYNLERDKIVSQELKPSNVWSAVVTPNDHYTDGQMLESNNLTINSYCGIGVNASIISFGSVVTGQESAEQSLLITNLGDSNADVLVSGTEWRTDSKTQPANSTRYANQSEVAFGSKTQLLEAQGTIYYGLAGGESFTGYFQLKPPFGTAGGAYTQNVTLTATC